ncbi:MAG: hypothetical protein IJ168_08905 [Eubacterium sp.]|nr:hypothetical protein [Eubacterium sp.]
MARKNRWEYLNDFRKDESGKYEYTGSLYGFAGSEEARKRAYTKLWVLLAAAAAASVSSGCVSGAGLTNTFYVILPYIGEICALFALTWYHCKLLTKGDEVRGYIYQKTQPRMAPAAMILAFFAIAGLLTSVIFSVMTAFKDGVWQAAVYWVLKATAASLALCYRSLFAKLEWIELP